VPEGGGDQLRLLHVRVFTTQAHWMYCMHVPTGEDESSIKNRSCTT